MGGRSGVRKGVLWVWFLNGILLGYSDKILLGQANECELGESYGDLLGNVEWTPTR